MPIKERVATTAERMIQTMDEWKISREINRASFKKRVNDSLSVTQSDTLFQRVEGCN